MDNENEIIEVMDTTEEPATETVTEAVTEAAVEPVTETASESETSGKKYPPQMSLTIRAIVGGYVLYLAYQIATSDNEVTIPMWIAVGLFVVAGAGLVIMSIKHFICGEYEGGKKDNN